MVVRVPVAPPVLAWAQERSRVDPAALARRFPKLGEWEDGTTLPTLKQLNAFAEATHTPVGFLYLSEPPADRIPIPDYRTIANAGVARPSADLLDTIFHCQQRQEWYREFAQVTGERSLDFIGSLTLQDSVLDAANAMRDRLEFDLDQRGPTWSEALRRLVEGAENLGVLVMTNGVVGSNTHRRLDPNEFRGFALVDPLAPLIFINGADTKAAQIFTVAHELAHLWLGETALSDAALNDVSTVSAERWCNEVAAELLVPESAIGGDFATGPELTEELDRLARRFKVSTLVVLRRLRDVGHLANAQYRTAYEAELTRVLEIVEARSSTGGNYYNTQPVRVSKRFARALITSTLEGQTLHRDAFQLLGLKKMSTFQEMASRLGVT